MLLSHQYQVSGRPGVQDPTGDHVLHCNRCSLDIMVFISVPIVNLLVLSPGKAFWVIPVRTGLGHDVLPPAPSPRGAHGGCSWYGHYSLLKCSGPSADLRAVFKIPCLDGNV